MISLELLRNFLAVYRAGSVSRAARQRLVTQSAVSQQLAALETYIGAPLSDRTAKGMVPTPRGATLYGELFESLDRVERVARNLRRRRGSNAALRLGTSPEYFQGFAMGRIGGLGVPLIVRFGEDRGLLDDVESGACDVAVTITKPSARTLQFQPLDEERFVLIGPRRSSVPLPGSSPAELASWLNSQPWVSYSEDRPITRRFWQQALGSRFEARAALVVPDLRSVIAGVESGIGLSIVPEYMCRAALADGRVQEIWPVRHLIPSERWFATYREVDSDREEIRLVCDALAKL